MAKTCLVEGWGFVMGDGSDDFGLICLNIFAFNSQTAQQIYVSVMWLFFPHVLGPAVTGNELKKIV